jgi:hypothetical protein
MKTKTIASAAFMLLLSASLCLCGENAFAQVAGRTTRVAKGATLPVGAEQFTEFILTSGSPQVYICNNNPCAVSGDWVTNSGSVAGANIALSNLSGTALNTTIYAATGITATLSGYVGTASLNPTGASLLGGAGYTATSQTPGSVLLAPGAPAAVGATPGNINFTGAAGFGTTGLGSNIYVQTGAGGSTSPLHAGLMSFGVGGATPVASETSPLSGSYVPSLYVLAGPTSTYGGEIDLVGNGSALGVVRVTNMNFAFYADNTYDFDLAAYRPRNVYVGTGFYLGSTSVGFTGETSLVSGNLMAAGTVAGSSKFLCTDASGNLSITTSGCPTIPSTSTLVSGNYVSASGAAATQDSTVNAGPYLGSTLPWETAPNCSAASLGTITSSNKGYIFGLALEFPAKTSALWYDVLTADNSANQYDVALYQGAPSGTENRLLHIGASSSTGQPGTTFSPAVGWQHLNWLEGATTLQPGRYYLMFTSSCTTGGTGCAQIAANAASAMFYWPGTGGVSIATGGASPLTYTSSADSPNFSTVPCMFVE